MNSETFLSGKVDEKLLWILPSVVLVALMVFALGSIPGIVRDEAIFGLVAIDIVDGARPVRGYFNEYTSPLYYYLVAFVFKLFGESVWSLRLASILFNALAVAALVDVIRRHDPRLAIYTLWLLITMPAFVVFSRMAGENFALNAFFVFGGIWCFAVLGASESKLKSRVGYALAGLSFGLGVWNHIIVLPTVVAVVIAYLAWHRPDRRQLLKSAPAFLAGGFIAAIPKLSLIIWAGHRLIPASSRDQLASLQSSLLNFIYTLGGDGLFVRRTGEIVLSMHWFLPAVFVAAAMYALSGRVESKYKRAWLVVLTCLALSFAGTWFIAPQVTLGSRFWLLPLWFSAVAMAVAVAAIGDARKRFVIGTVVVLVNLTAVGTNYFFAFARTGGIPVEKVYVGGRYDTAHDFVRMQPFVKRLVKYNDKPIFVEDVSSWRVKFLSPAGARNRVYTVDDMVKQGVPVVPGSLVAFHRFEDRIYVPAIRLNQYLLVARPQLSSHAYMVYEYVPGQD